MPSSSKTTTDAHSKPWNAEDINATAVPALNEGYSAARGSGMADSLSGYIRGALGPGFTDVANDPTANAIGQRGLAASRIAMQKMAGMSGRSFGTGGEMNDLGRFADIDMQRASAAPLYDLYAKKLALQQGAAGMAPAAQAMYQDPSLKFAGAKTGIGALGQDSHSVSTTTQSNPMGMALSFARLAMGDPTALIGMGANAFGSQAGGNYTQSFPGGGTVSGYSAPMGTFPWDSAGYAWT